MEVKCAQNLSHEVCGVIITSCGRCTMRANSVHVRHATVEVQVHRVNVVIGVVLVVLLVVHVVPVVFVDAVVHCTLVLIAFS